MKFKKHVFSFLVSPPIHPPIVPIMAFFLRAHLLAAPNQRLGLDGEGRRRQEGLLVRLPVDEVGHGLASGPCGDQVRRAGRPGSPEAKRTEMAFA